jgi:hypothetical protein
MKTIALLLCLAGASWADPIGPDEATRIKIAEYMLRTPMNEADPALVAGFMKLDAAALPKKLRDKALAKQMEVDAIVKIHKGKKKGPFRFPSPNCVPKRYGPEGVRVMSLISGNSEIAWEEEEYVELKTNCTEDQLICEFSLNVVVIPRPGKPPLKRFYLMEADPLMALVGEKRSGGGSAGNKYFQELKPSCQKPASP